MTPEITNPIWNTSSDQSPELDRDLEVDVAIVGGGLTGLLTALDLLRAGKSVAVFERDRVACAETGHTTAHLTALLDTRYRDLGRDFGWDQARRIARSHVQAIDRIETLSREIPCEFKRVPIYLYAEISRPDGIPEAKQLAELAELAGLKEELDALERVGLPAIWEKNLPLPFPTQGGLKVANQARFHPGRFMEGIAKLVAREGGRIFEQTPVETVNGSILRTPHAEVRAKEVVMATHSPTFNLLVLQTKIAAYRSYAIAAQLDHPPAEDALYMDADDPYHYIRREGDSWIIGGEDHKTGHADEGKVHTESQDNPSPSESPFARLEAYARDHFGASRVSHRWSGQILEPVDGLAYIGTNPGHAHQYVATGYSGNGMTYAAVAADLISDLILKRENPNAGLYRPSRIKPLASAREFLTENVDFPVCLIGGAIRPAEAHSPEEIQPGEGKILRHEGHDLAAYRDDSGKLHAVSAICTHMACHVRFNANERTWDCPCHGGRFSVDGAVLNGPANAPLKRVEV